MLFSVSLRCIFFKRLNIGREVFLKKIGVICLRNIRNVESGFSGGFAGHPRDVYY